MGQCTLPLFCRNVTRRYVKPDSHSISFRFDKPTQANSKPFRIDYETLSFTNICSDNGKTITTLPYMVKSPNFPMNYPSEKSCYVNVNAPGAVDITVRSYCVCSEILRRPLFFALLSYFSCPPLRPAVAHQ